MTMQQHVARSLCWEAGKGRDDEDAPCRQCEGTQERCDMWPSFMGEAQVAIGAVKDFAIISMRNKPRLGK